MIKLKAYPVIVATVKIHKTKAITIFFLKIELSNDTSGMLAPAPPSISAIIIPGATPFAIRILAIGIIVSVRIYIGIPIIAASGTAHKLLVPAKFANKSVGINSYIKAPIPAPIIK